MNAKRNSPADAQRATAQRAEIHVGLSDQSLTALAMRAVPQAPQRPGSTYTAVVLGTNGGETQ